jgi:hypothetical protein
VHIQLPLPCATRADKQASDTTHLLLVFDRGSELPMGCTVSAYPPGEREVGTALYQAIWHPGRHNWPLHGIPEMIQIPAELATNGLPDLHRAAPFLLMEIDTHLKHPQNGLKQVKTIIKAIRTDGVSHLTATGSDKQTDGSIVDTLLAWLQEQYFPGHIPATVRESVRAQGVIMCGHDTPAAGWLLPVVGEAEAISQGVIFQGTTYGSARFVSKPSEKLPVRTYPFYYPQRGNGIFVQIGTGITACVQYLARQD